MDYNSKFPKRYNQKRHREQIGDGQREKMAREEPSENNDMIAYGFVIPVSVVYLNCLISSCPQTVTSVTNLNIHLADTHRMMEHRCPLMNCRFSCDKVKKLLQHQKSNHSHLNTWPCGHCTKKFSNQFDLSDHLEMAHTRGLYECGMKSKGCKFWAPYREPVKEHFDRKHIPRIETNKALQTLECEEGEVVEQGNLPKKQRTSIDSVEPVAEVAISSSIDQSIDAQLKSIRQSTKLATGNLGQVPTTNSFALPSQPLPYRIEYQLCLKKNCNETFTNTDDMNVHLKEKHAIDSFRCPLQICKDTFPSSQQLEHHLEDVHGDVTQWKCFLCDSSCPSQFTTPQQLSRHNQQVHFAGKFWCAKDGCSYHGEFRINVCRHFYSSHQMNDQIDKDADAALNVQHDKQAKPSNSESKTILATTSSTSELSTKDDVEQDTDQTNKYSTVSIKCLVDSCTEFFITEDKLNMHLDLIHNLKPFRCYLCERWFADGHQLEAHIGGSHIGVSEWKCTKCEKATKSHDKLALHHRLVHHEGFFKCTFKGCRKVLKARGRMMAHYDEHSEPKNTTL